MKKAFLEGSQSWLHWAKEIPPHWKARKLKYIAQVTFSSVDKHTNEGELPIRLCNYTDVYYNDFITRNMELMEASATPDEVKRFSLKKGDVLVTKDSEEWNDIAVPALVTDDMDNVLCGYHLALVRPNPDIIDGGYLFRAFSARGINDQFRVAATGITRYGLGKYSLDSGVVPVPPIEEQCEIATFLDQKIELIDSLQEKIERLGGTVAETKSALLLEYKIAIITAAVTGRIRITKEVRA